VSARASDTEEERANLKDLHGVLVKITDFDD
jgi:hypothetical protein